MTTISCASEQPGPSGLSASSHRGTGIGPSDLPRRRLLLAQEARGQTIPVLPIRVLPI